METSTSRLHQEGGPLDGAGADCRYAPDGRPTRGTGDGVSLPTPTRILVVDDHRPNVVLLARHLQGLGYDVATADSGPEALEVIAAVRPDIVLLDIAMPGMSGLDVLRRLRGEPATDDLPVILVSGRDTTEDVVEGLRLGAYDYVTKPINLPILEARLETRAALKRSRDELKQTAQLQAAEIERTAQEMHAAGEVQRSILPRTPLHTDTLAIAWSYEPITEVGGDLFDVIPLPGGRTLLFVADAMGHGVQAALVVSTVKATLAAHLHEADDLPILMGLLDLAVGDLFADRFVTAAACVVDPDARLLRYVVAGHPPILVSSPGGVVALEAGGLPLGTGLNLGNPGGAIALDPGAAILLYTDGLTEARSPLHGSFGIERLVEGFGRHAASDPDSMVRILRETLDEYRGPEPLDDDLTILAARLR
ncbi:MAG TPA: SpoIIE family protein phosphatase [Isosphaeraceae bacterium]